MTWLWVCVGGELVAAGLLAVRGEQADAAMAVTLALWMIVRLGPRRLR
jgi:hypothetical protein